MRLPGTAHTSRPWRIHELSRDFRLQDVWALPVTGSKDDFPQVVEMLAGGGLFASSSGVARMVWRIRWKIGAVLGLDRPGTGLGSRVRPLRGRLPVSTGGYRGQLAVLVKPNGLLGAAYLAAIKPFRYLIVYPSMMRDLGRR